MVYFAATPQLSTSFIYRYSNQAKLVDKILSAVQKIGTDDDQLILMAPKAKEGSDDPSGLLVHYKPKNSLGLPNRALILAENHDRFTTIRRSMATRFENLHAFKFLNPDKRKQELEQLLFWLKDTFGVKPDSKCSYASKKDLKVFKRELLSIIPPAKRRQSK